ncbi:hypothetical protein FQN50_000502 [Emmonsiellopsis sp. PD_5]|nr:hypothetical protein FQN50_000502 [Emmonsiellopsis sp. PD_5]
MAVPNMYEIMRVSARLIEPLPGFADRATAFLRFQFAIQFLLYTGLWSVKFSLLFFFWRLFDSVQSPMRIFWWIMVGITTSTYITSVGLQLVACDPISNFFVLGACASSRDIFYSNLVFKFHVGTDIAGDIFIMIIPFPLLRKLHMDSRQKWILAGIFCLPIIPIILAVLRFVLTNPREDGNVDPIRYQFFSMLENSTGNHNNVLSTIYSSLRWPIQVLNVLQQLGVSRLSSWV